MLTVLSVAYPFAPVTADPVGGAEQVLAQLDRALVAAGHRSIVIACEGSAPAGELRTIPAVDTHDIGGPEWALAHASIRARMAEAIAEGVDLIHLHGFDFDSYVPPPGPPVLVTLHLPLDWYVPDILRWDRPRTFLQPVSADQASRAPAGVVLTEPIPNGVDCARLYPEDGPKDYVAILGRVAPEKGFHDAIDAAKLAGAPLRAAGEVFPYVEHRRYFDEGIVPRLDAERRWIGPVQGEAKRRLIAGAKALLIPSTAPETSSLVAMEALACGTPVIAYRAGALPGIVDDGETGFLVDGVAEMAEAIGRVGRIDRARCRAVACERYSLERMIGAYFDLYRRLAAQRLAA